MAGTGYVLIKNIVKPLYPYFIYPRGSLYILFSRVYLEMCECVDMISTHQQLKRKKRYYIYTTAGKRLYRWNYTIRYIFKRVYSQRTILSASFSITVEIVSSTRPGMRNKIIKPARKEEKMSCRQSVLNRIRDAIFLR